jgi:hypothetical protein
MKVVKIDSSPTELEKRVARHTKGGLDSRGQGFKWFFSDDISSALMRFPIT